uniref:F-box domain-containing protein n=1 Tax=Oryza brachyantha TaxID=4533 RepID=J3LDX6_ORYBR
MGGAIERQGALRAAPWREPEAAELIPGLPDDVAMECLARVPIRSHRAMRHVCRGWRRAAAAAAVFVFGKADDGKHAAWVMDAGGARWRRVPVPPGFGGFVYSAASVRV